MKKVKIVVAFLLFAFATGVNAQDSAETAKISFDKDVHNYGVIEKSSDGSCVFTFKNEGSVPLVLSKVSSSCGCTVPAWPKEPIEPGEAGEIKVKYNTNRLGTFTKSITVHSNATESTKVLRIKGEVKDK